jgi:hypothetical protein
VYIIINSHVEEVEVSQKTWPHVQPLLLALVALACLPTSVK